MVWVWLALLLGVCVEATSNGVALTCDVDNANLGSTMRKTKNPNRTMWWVLPPVFANNQYTLRTADPSTASDKTAYTPGKWMDLYLRTTGQDQQFTGLVLYAVNDNNQKVGRWQVPDLSPYHVSTSDNCVVHSNADPKNYLSTFKFQGPPVGSGTVTIKALIKFGLAFPSDTGTFFWPNNEHLQLTEGPSVSQTWFEGEVGDSCIKTCLKHNLGCDSATMRRVGTNATSLLAQARGYSNCTGPVLPGCSAHSPSTGLAGCFYHSETCQQPPAQPQWVRNDPCANLSAWAPGVYCQNAGQCVKYNNTVWCCTGYTSSTPGGDGQYNGWGIYAGGGAFGSCMPAGGWPAGQGSVPLAARVNPGPTGITCEATSNSPLDGRRICACSDGGQRVANSALQATLPLGTFFLCLIALF